MSQNEQHKRPFGVLVLRMIAGVVAVFAVPAFVLLAVVPMLLMLAPVALLAIPFMIVAFAGSASDASAKASAVQLASRRPMPRAAAREVTP
jgi:hypothetical protein